MPASNHIGEDFLARFGTKARIFRAPARVNIIGEHTDYNDGLVMPVNTGLFTWLAAAPREDRRIKIVADGFGEAEFCLDSIGKGDSEPWCEYVKGVATVLQEEGHFLCGANMVVRGEIPVGGGLSSSASLETVVALALLSLNRQKIDRHAMALACQRAENEFVGVACGIMDQYVISMCEENHSMMLDCRSLEYRSPPLPEDAEFLVVHSGVNHSLVDGEYNSRRAECAKAVKVLGGLAPGIEALRDVSPGLLEQGRSQLDDTSYRRARHVVTEIARVSEAAEAMEAGDSARLGELINASHDSLRDDYQVSCEELDTLVGIARNQPGVLGSRMVGAGFGGCMVTLIRRDHYSAASKAVVSEYEKLTGEMPWHHRVDPAGPVSEVGAA